MILADAEYSTDNTGLILGLILVGFALVVLVNFFRKR